MADHPNLEKYKTAIHSTAKAIARSNLKEKKEKFEKITKTKILSSENKEEILEARVLADSEALKIKYSDENILNKNLPTGTISKTIYNIAEKIRYEKIGSDQYKGIKSNLNNSDNWYNVLITCNKNTGFYYKIYDINNLLIKDENILSVGINN